MIDINDVSLVTAEDYLQRIADNNAAIRDLINENEVLTKLYAQERRLTASEAADYLRCAVQNIPRDIPRVKVGKNFIYSKGDLETWIKNAKRGGKGTV